MGKITYLFKRIFTLNYSRMFNVIKDISNKIHKSYIFVFFDVVYCGLKYGAGYLDYQLFEMYNLTQEQRKTYLTRGKNNEFIKKYNSKEHFNDFDNKVQFNKIFNDFLKRKWIYLKEQDKEQSIAWIKNIKNFVAKTVDGSCGKGVKKIQVNEYNTIEELYNYLIENNYLLLEELVLQHPDLNNLHPNSVNTVRIVTILGKNKATIVGAFLRIGNGKFVDNLNSGGMAVPINIDTGIIEYPAADKNGKIYYKHPITNVDIIGFKIPMWNEILELVNKASKVIPSVRYVGWDVSPTEIGPVFIEGNPFPGHDIYQLPIHTPNKIGVLPRYLEAEN